MKYPLGWKLDPFFSASFTTQLTESFMMVKDEKTASAKFWDPVTSQQDWGFAYSYRQGRDNLESRIGFSLKQVRAHKYTRLTDDRKTKDIKERWKPESGISWKTNCTWQLDSLVTYRGTLDLFGTFEDMNKWTVAFRNEFQLKIWSIVAVTLKADIIYDEKACLRPQYTQALRIGAAAQMPPY